MQTNYVSIRLFIICLLFICHAAIAADKVADDKTRSQVIKISADSMQLDVSNGDSEYRGNVHIQKGSISLQGELVIISRQDGDVDIIRISGKPASYRQQTEQGNTEAQSESMLFDVGTSILTMTTNARLLQDKQLIESQSIQFDTDKQTILAGKSPANARDGKTRQRVNITLTPDNKKN